MLRHTFEKNFNICEEIYRENYKESSTKFEC
jgi:hypothetical protein